MDRFRKHKDLDDGHLPLREFVAPEGRRSRSLSLERSDSRFDSPLDRVDDKDEGMRFRVQQTASPLLDHTGTNRQTEATNHHATHPSHLKIKPLVEQRFTRLLLSGLPRCFISWLLIGAFYILVWKYEDRVLSPRTKSSFDCITVALSIAFGLNIASALKAVARDLRWWILSMGQRSSREVELLLHSDSLTELLKLLLVAPRPKIIAVTLFWLSLNILAQAGIAMLGLTYSASPGIGDIYREPGLNNISIPNMTSFAPTAGRFSDDITFTEAFAAHMLGDIGSSYNFSLLPTTPLEGTPLASNPAGFWNVTDHWEYHFLDSAPSAGMSGAQYLALYSNRIVKSTGTCATPPYQVAVNGGLAVVHRLSGNQTAAFPSLALGTESIYYLTTPIPDDGTNNGICGPGCSNVKVLEPATGPPVDGSFVKGSNSTYFFYDCNITLTSTTPDLPSVKAALAAQAIALSGQIHPEFQNTDEESNQFVAYNFGLPFGEPQNNSAVGMASLVSRFAISVISAAAQTNPPILVPGSLPAQGVRLEFDSFLDFNLILILTGTLQTILVLVTAVIVSRASIPEDILLSNQMDMWKRFVII